MIGAITMYKCKHYVIKELVSPAVYNYYTKLYGVIAGENLMWSFFGEAELRDLDTIREEWKRELIINNWASCGEFTQCGLRSNIEPLTKDHTVKNIPYCGGHNFAKGFDLHDKQGDNKGLHAFVCGLIKQGKLKAFRRVENLISAPTWTHTDSFQTPNNQLLIF